MPERSESDSANLSPDKLPPEESTESGFERQAQDPADSDPLERVLSRGMPAMGAGYARYAGVGIHFAVTILAFAYAGYRLDLWLDSSPWFLLVGVFVGFFGAMVSLVNKVKKVTAEQAAPSPQTASRDEKPKT